MHGIYSPAVKGSKCIYLNAWDETLRHWTQNAMNRNGYLCLECSGTDRKPGLPMLDVQAANRLVLTVGTASEVYSSFESLLTSPMLTIQA